jgi:hypothetical protein
MRSTLFCLAILCLAVSCGDGDNPGADGGGGGGSDGGGGGGADAGPSDWQALISGDWTLNPGSETYRCVRLTVSEDTYISEFRAIAPLGTHHTVLTVGDPSGDDGISNCNAGTNADAMIFGSGVGTNPIAFPEGVAMKIEAGQQLLLNLHLFNVADNQLDGTSGTEIVTIPESEVEQVAEVILMGRTVSLQVPPGESTQIGRCVMNGDVNIFAFSPHMHQMGTHMKIVAKPSSGDVTLHDAAYDFYEQKVFLSEPAIQLEAGDEIEVHCGYDNTSNSTIPFGDSSNQEMCFAGVYRYPAFGSPFGIVCDSSGF